MGNLVFHSFSQYICHFLGMAEYSIKMVLYNMHTSQCDQLQTISFTISLKSKRYTNDNGLLLIG